MNALSLAPYKRMAHRRKASRVASACSVSMLRVAALRFARARVTDISKDGEAAKVAYLHNAQGQRVFKSEPQTAQTLPSETELGTGFVDWLKKNFGWLYATAQTNATIGTAYSYGEASIPSWALLGEYGNGGASSSGRTEYIWLPQDDGQAIPVGLFRNNRYYTIHSDHLGTPRLVKDDTAKPVWQWSYSAFGDNKPTGILKATTNPNSALTNEPNLLAATSVGTALNLRFPGQYFDSETGLFYNYYRSYLASQGRYTQNDPIGLEGGLSRFGYVEGNPVSYIDPYGLFDITNPADWPQLPPDIAKCIESRRWDWGKLGPQGDEPPTLTGNLVTGSNLANSVGNLAAGATGSGIASTSHATSWQHRVGSSIGQAAQKAQNGRRFGPLQAKISQYGKVAGRVAILPTMWEGYWDIGSIAYCTCTGR